MKEKVVTDSDAKAFADLPEHLHIGRLARALLKAREALRKCQQPSLKCVCEVLKGDKCLFCITIEALEGTL